MKLSGHNYDNDVFKSLLEGWGDKVVIKTEEKQEDPTTITGMDVFSSTTEDVLKDIHSDDLNNIAQELQFAADRARVAVSAPDLVKFAKDVNSQGLRGKKLERAAQKYCNNLHAEIADPQGDSRSSSLIDKLAAHRVISATCDTSYGINDSKTGGYMGMTSNPNSIWDTEAMTRLAQTQTADEKMKETKQANKDRREELKQASWDDLKESLSDPMNIHDKITNAGTSSTNEVVNNNLPSNSMSIFSDDRDFNNIPDQTQGEKLAAVSLERATKSAEAKQEWNKVVGATKAKNTSESLFDKAMAATRKDGAEIDQQFKGLSEG